MNLLESSRTVLNECKHVTRRHLRILPHCGFRSCLAAPVETLRPGLGPCWAAVAEPRYPLRGGIEVGFRNGTPKPGLTLIQYCSKPSPQARRIQPVGTRQGPRLEEPSLPSWEPCRGKQKPRLGVGSPATGIGVTRWSGLIQGFYLCLKGLCLFANKRWLSSKPEHSSISTWAEQTGSHIKQNRKYIGTPFIFVRTATNRYIQIPTSHTSQSYFTSNIYRRELIWF